MFNLGHKSNTEKTIELKRAVKKLEYAFDLMRQDNLEFMDAFLNRRIFELKEGIMILRKIVGSKKDDVVGVMIVELVREFYKGDITKEEFMNLILNNEETYLKYEKMLDKDTL